MSARQYMVPKPFDVGEDLNWIALYEAQSAENDAQYSNNANLDYLYDSSGNGRDALRGEAANSEFIYVTSSNINSKPAFRCDSPTPGTDFVGHAFNLSLTTNIESWSVVMVVDLETPAGDGFQSGYLYNMKRQKGGGSGGTSLRSEELRLLDDSASPYTDFFVVPKYADDDTVTPNYGSSTTNSATFSPGTHGFVHRLVGTESKTYRNGSLFVSDTDRLVDSGEAWDDSETFAVWGLADVNNNLYPGDFAFVGFYDGDVTADPNWSKLQDYISNEYGVTI